MAEKSLGRHWKDLKDEQKKEWVAAFRDFMVANYAANLDKNTGQKFEVIGEEKAEHDTTLVKGRVVDPAAAPEIVAPTGLSADDLRTRIGAALMALESER